VCSQEPIRAFSVDVDEPLAAAHLDAKMRANSEDVCRDTQFYVTVADASDVGAGAFSAPLNEPVDKLEDAAST